MIGVSYGMRQQYLMSNWSFWNWAQRIERAREFWTITFYMVRRAQRK